jgi:uncharacterized protein (UPF0332 family)
MLDNQQPQDGITFFRQKMHVTLDAAHCLINNDFHSDSINRLYYAAMYAAKTLLLTKGVSVKSHQATLRLFGLYFSTTEIVPNDIVKHLSALSRIRIKADYDLGFIVTVDKTMEYQQAAVEFVEMADKLLREMDNGNANPSVDSLQDG